MSSTKIVGTISLVLAFLTPLIMAMASDPQFVKYAILLNGLINGLNAVGNILSRSNKVSDQQAGARVDDGTGGFKDAKPSTPTASVDFMTNVGGFVGRKP